MSKLLQERWNKIAFLSEAQGPCWDGYERVPGTKEKEKGSCRKKGSANESDEMMDEVQEIQEVSKKVKSMLAEKNGLWDNIRAKDEQIKKGSGEKKAKPGDDDYPATLDVNESDEILDETDEGNAFSGARQDAIDNDEDEFEVDGEKYKVSGDTTKSMTEGQLRRVIRKAILEACYDGRKVTLNKKMSNPENKNKKSKVYVTGKGKYKSGPCKGQNKAKKVQFGDPNMRIKKNNPKNRKSFRARHNCDNPGPKDKARYWSCKSW